jgi:hypothetical protein
VPDYRQEGNFSQRDQRRNVRLIDQWGRTYHASIELKSGATCGLVQPLYTSVLPVPLMYLERSRDELRPYDVFVNVEKWLADTRRERREWEERGRKLSARKYGPEWDSRKEFSQDVLELLGPAPSAVEPIIALKQGNSWILGKTKTVDKRLAKYFAPEVLDPGYVTANEPDFRDEGLYDDAGTAFEVPDYSVEEDEKTEWDQKFAAGKQDIAERLESKAERRARLLAELEALDDDGADPLGTEEYADPRAIGGKTVPVVTNKVRSAEAERKAKARREKKERDEAAQRAAEAAAAGVEAAKARELARMEAAEQDAIRRAEAGETGQRSPVERDVLGEEDQELLESVAG